MLGEHLVSKASNGAKKMDVKADADDLYDIFQNGFSKSLRYGASLELTDVRIVVCMLKLLNENSIMHRKQRSACKVATWHDCVSDNRIQGCLSACRRLLSDLCS